ncbi:hypothetical protein QQX98_008205 [Neonectria punicea]|uniref:Major facilitator superfamily (MFS) profile domain-containing protein n=1 Tax=Neonectria punicea TaxID=979145 RepID=A0ABR1GVQ5_9HYPO
MQNNPTSLLQADAAVTERTPLLDPDVNNKIPVVTSFCNYQDGERTIINNNLSFMRLALIMSTAWFGVFLGAADSTIIATLSAPISSEFNSLTLLPWLATAYLISMAACQPISGRLTDIFGRGPGLVLSNIVFAIGNLICGMATNQGTMILGRVVAGLGGGGLMSIPTFLGSDLIPLRKRGLVGGIANLWYGLGAMVGGIFGGLLNDHTDLGWRLAFLIQVPPAMLSAIAVLMLVKVPPKESDKSYLARIDFFGVFLTSSFLVLLVLGLSSGGNLVPWTHPLPLTTISLSVVLFAGFIWWESKALQPIIPVKLLLHRTILASCLTSLLSAMLAMTCIFYIPLYLQVLGDSATNAGIKILPASLGLSAGALGAGYMMKKTGSPAWITSFAFFVVGGGYNGVFTITQIACIAAVDHSQQAVVTSTTYLARSLGGTAGITIASVVYQGTLKARLRDRFGDYPDSDEQIRRILDDLGELTSLPEGWYDGIGRLVHYCTVGFTQFMAISD